MSRMSRMKNVFFDFARFFDFAHSVSLLTLPFDSAHSASLLTLLGLEGNDLVFLHMTFGMLSMSHMHTRHTRGLAVPQYISSLIPFSFQTFECHTGFCDSGSDLIINVHCSGESASQVGEFINNFQFLAFHSDSWFIARFSRGWLVYNLCLFVLIVKSYLSHDCET